MYENLQVLCAKCNRTKRNLDKTDFRNIVGEEIVPGCQFCGVSQDRILIENELALAISDKYPVSSGHTLVIPKRHVADYFDATKSEQNAINDILRIRRKQLLENNGLITGFNVGVNCGEAAGQTIFHCHVHLIPRCQGDTANPRGGVRGVIPSRMSNWISSLKILLTKWLSSVFAGMSKSALWRFYFVRALYPLSEKK